jgi:DNA polymerase-3 subunit gamma/tau
MEARFCRCAAAEPEAAPQPGRLELPAPESFAAAVALVREQGEGILANHLMDDVHLVRYEPGRIELRVTDAALASRFGAVLEKTCGGRWVITISQQPGSETLRHQARADEAAKRAAVMQHPLVQAIIETFPEAKLVARRDPKAPPRAPEPDDADEGADER